MNAIRDLMSYWEHCHECGAIMVTVPGGAICPHCNFELDDPEENTRLSLPFPMLDSWQNRQSWMEDDRPEIAVDEAA